MITDIERLTRLLHLKRVVEKVPDGNFSMLHWAKRFQSCGTVACVGGYAGMDAYFNRLGLRLDFLKGDAGYLILRDEEISIIGLINLFGITEKEADLVFFDLLQPYSIKAALERIEAVIDRYSLINYDAYQKAQANVQEWINDTQTN